MRMPKPKQIALSATDVQPVERLCSNPKSLIKTLNDLQLSLEEKSVAGSELIANRVTDELGVLAGVGVKADWLFGLLAHTHPPAPLEEEPQLWRYVVLRLGY